MVSITPDRREKTGLWNHPVRWLLGLALVLVLAGCTLEQDVRIGTNQEWSADYLMEMPAETVEMMGGVEEVRTLMEQDQPDAEGYEMSLRLEERGDSVAIIGEASGTGFDQLNEAMFESGATITSGEGDQVSISHFYGASDMDAMGGAMEVVVRIAGSEIVESNADRVEGGTAIWENPDQIDVTLLTIVRGTLEQDVRIGTNQEWAADYLMEMPAETVEMMGGIEELRTAIETQLPDTEGQDVTVQVEERGDMVTVVAQASGSGFDNLNDALFENGATISSGQDNQVSIQVNADTNSMSSLDVIGPMTLTISAKQIVNSNADRVEDGIATWENPDQIEVTLVSGGGNLLGGILAGAIAFVVLLGLAIGGMMWFQKKGSAGGSSKAPSSS